MMGLPYGMAITIGDAFFAVSGGFRHQAQSGSTEVIGHLDMGNASV